MKTREFSFNLPQDFIAQHPMERRDESRLMVVDRNTRSISHHTFSELVNLLPPETLLVLNDSRVRKARLFAESETGGTVEFMLLRKRDDTTWEALVQKSKKQRPGKTFRFPGDVTGTIVESSDHAKLVRFAHPLDETYFDKFGHMPLPPYIRREDQPLDDERYQTVFSGSTGSVAAPTAGLHFTSDLLRNLSRRGIQHCFITLHVGIGTFLPIRTENVEDHRMHEESYSISDSSCLMINSARQKGGNITAVGTTSVRTLESAAREGACRAGSASTDLYIVPGYTFSMVDHLITNFHTPESSLLVLVSAFAGKELIEEAYHCAIREEYRFFSYGDAMLIL